MKHFIKTIVALLVLVLAISFVACDWSIAEEIIERLPYDLESWHEHSWDNWIIGYGEEDVSLVCSVCSETVKSYPTSQGLEIDENGVLVSRGGCKDQYIIVPFGVTEIGEGAFENENDILGVLLPSTVTKIGDNAFKNCGGLQVINLPEGVVEIGDNAFSSCKSLIGIVIPNSVKKIGKMAFSNCGMLEIIYYVGTEEEWSNISKGKDWDKGAGKHVIDHKKPHNGNGGHHGGGNGGNSGDHGGDDYPDQGEASKGLHMLLNEDKKSYSVGGIGNCRDKDIVIPSTYNGLPVTGIWGNAFWHHTTITSVVIPNSIKTIGHAAFEGCTALTSVTIPNSVSKINTYAFYNCKSLTNVYMSESVEEIGDYAFVECSSLVQIEVSDKNTHYMSVDGVLYSKDEKKLIQYPAGNNETKFDMPNSVTEIGLGAFYHCNSLHEINISDSLKSIGSWAFAYCYSLTVVEIPDSVISVGEWAFEGCGGLNLNEYQGALYLGSKTNPYHILFYSHVKEIHPDTVVIADRAFEFAPLEGEIVIPDSVITIGNNAFYLSTIQGLKIPRSTQYIGYGILGGCYEAEYIEVDDYNPYYKDINGSLYNKEETVLMQYASAPTQKTFAIPNTVKIIGQEAFFGTGTHLQAITIPSSVTAIDMWAFQDCSFQNVYLPASVSSVGNGALGECQQLTNISVDKNNKHFTSIDGNLYTKDGKWLLQYATGKQEDSFVVPYGVTAIKDYSFYNCNSIVDVIMPDSVTYVGNYAFVQCSNLTNVSMSSSITRIGIYAFAYCNSLKNISIPNLTRLLGSNAFLECRSLEKITLPGSLWSVGSQAFGGCSNLTEVYISEYVLYLGGAVFRESLSLTIYCGIESQPEEWDVNWNYSNRPVIWGYKGE